MSGVGRMKFRAPSLSVWVGAKRGQDGEPFTFVIANSKLFLTVQGLCGIRAVLYTFNMVGKERKSSGKSRTGV